VDGTLASSNLVFAYLDFQLWRLPRWKWLGWLALFLPRVPYYLVLDAISRQRFNTSFFRNYSGIRRDDLERWAEEAVHGFWQRRLFRDGLERLRHHRAQGHRVVLVAGNLKPILDPLGAWLQADAVVGAQPETIGDRLTGRLMGDPMSGGAKAVAARRAAELLGIDLAQSYAYTDSYDDRTLLECVGSPVAVNPDWRLWRLIRRRGWPSVHWGGSLRHPPARANRRPQGEQEGQGL
jgi:HAD superfamily hydrolase (TIGR01490 family)